MGIMRVAQLGKYLLYKNQELSLIPELSLKKKLGTVGDTCLYCSAERQRQ